MQYHHQMHEVSITNFRCRVAGAKFLSVIGSFYPRFCKDTNKNVFFSNIIIVRTNVSVVTCATPKLSKIIIRFSAQKSKVMHCFLHAYLFRTGLALMNDSRQFWYIYDSELVIYNKERYFLHIIRIYL